MMLGRVNAGAERRAQHHRAREPAARAIAQSRGVIEDLIDRRIDEPHELDLGDRPKALRGEPDAHAGDEPFGERRIDDALLTEPLEQAGRRAEHSAVDADVFAEQDDARIGRELVRERLIDRLDECDLAHGSLAAEQGIALFLQRRRQLREQVVEHRLGRQWAGCEVVAHGLLDLRGLARPAAAPLRASLHMPARTRYLCKRAIGSRARCCSSSSAGR